MNQQTAKVLWNKEVGPSYFRLGLSTDKSYSDAIPGQFITLKIDAGYDPLLRRPFSIHRLIPRVITGENKDVRGIEVLFKVVGRSTRQLSELKTEDPISILGPLGQGFTVQESHRDVILAAGGIGIAPLLFLAESLVEKGVDPSCCRVFIGGGTAGDLLCIDDFVSLAMDIKTSTDDGSSGHKGLVTDILEKAVDEKKPDVIFACGPHLMLEAVAGIAKNRDIESQLSLETIMVCGIGACLGCAVKVENNSGKYGHICVDGPVFDSKSVFIQ